MTPVERRVLAAVAIVVLHFAILLSLLGVLKALAGVESAGDLAPREPMLTLIVSLLQAWCGLGAIWWGNSGWPSHVRTLTAALAAAILWALLILVLENTDFASDGSAGWGASFITHALATALGMVLVERARRRECGKGDRRFTILFLMIWMAVVGLVLGGLRWLATSFGWTLAVVQWEFFLQLQAIALFNALLAISLWTVLQARRNWRSRWVVCGLVTLSLMFIVNVLMAAIFADVGATIADICWLYGGQAAFLLATIAPLRVAQDFETLTAAGQTPPPPDSGR
jgi:hypothetical protein